MDGFDMDTMVSHEAFWPIAVFLILGLIYRSVYFSSPKNSSSSKSSSNLVMSLAWLALWAVVLYYVCVTFGRMWGWIFVFVPYIFLGFVSSVSWSYNPSCMQSCTQTCMQQ